MCDTTLLSHSIHSGSSGVLYINHVFLDKSSRRRSASLFSNFAMPCLHDMSVGELFEELKLPSSDLLQIAALHLARRSDTESASFLSEFVYQAPLTYLSSSFPDIFRTSLSDSNMPQSEWKAATNNNPNIIVTLLPRSFRAYDAWADPHNAPFYIHPDSQATDRHPQGVTIGQDDARQPITDANKNAPSEPALQLSFSRKLRNLELGYLLGSDRSICDIYLGSLDDKIRQRMFVVDFNKYNDVVLKSISDANVLVSYDKQEEERKQFTWILVEEQKSILVTATRRLQFTVEVPKHETDKKAYEYNCQKFWELANSISRTLNLGNPSSQPATAPVSGTTTSVATDIRPFYLRTAKLGEGTFGKVHLARSMPDGSTVAVKRFKSQKAFAVEANILKKISKTPHVSATPSRSTNLLIRPGQYCPIHGMSTRYQGLLCHGVCSGGNFGGTTQADAVQDPGNCPHEPPNAGRTCILTSGL